MNGLDTQSQFPQWTLSLSLAVHPGGTPLAGWFTWQPGLVEFSYQPCSFTLDLCELNDPKRIPNCP